MKRQLIVLLSILFLVQVAYQAPVKKTELLDNWTVEILSGSSESKSLQGKKFNTTLPTTLHLDLFAHGQIEDPFLKDTHKSLGWVSDSNVVYATTFSLDADILKYKNHRLVFEGIDTYGKVILNGETILSTENAFREYSVIVNQYLKTGQNELEVHINSAKENDAKGQREDPMPFEYAHTRKACYQYGWDWAPRLVTMGIWKKVYIESFEDIQINYVWARNRYISEKKAIVNFAVALDIPEVIEETYQIVVKHEDKVIGKNSKIKERNVYVDVEILEPKLWWPNGIGIPFIYDFVVEIQLSNNSTIDSRKIPYGIRSVKLNQKDKQFTIVVNGYPVYGKGANYVPMDMFYPRIYNKNYKSGNTVENMMNDIADSHFNMIRLWGGGQYESDEFFEAASRKGIMIFYDFMFSDSVYPATENFLVNVEEEIKQQVRRARNYPCLALWSGNNEILQGINDWGWSSQKYRDNYKRLFETLIPKILEIENPEISYIPSSPVYGVGNYGFDRGGDFHYWGVWAAGSQFESYGSAIGPFNSEFGTQALPVWETIIQTVSEADRKYESQILLSHEKHSSQFGMLKNYMNQYMRTALNFELETYQSGLLQAYAIEYAIKVQRSNKPKSMGTLYWQLNDAWPAISWSSIDYFGRWKPLQFMAKRLYPDIAIVFTESKGVSIINDKLYPVKVVALIQLVTFDGEYLLNQTETVNLEANEVKHLNVSLEKARGREGSVVLYTEVIGGRKEVMSSTHFFKKFKDLELPEGELTVEYHPEYKEITLSSTKLLKNVFIGNSKEYLKTNDNYFDLVPGHKVKIQILNDTPYEQLADSMFYRSYYQVYQKSDLKVNVVK